MQLSVTPTDGPADEAPAIRVSGAPPSAPVTITAETTDAAGHRWEARCVFTANADGTVDLSRDAPVSGTYEGLDPAGLLWSMRFASEDVAPVRFAAPADQLAVSLTATAANGEAGATMVRRWSGPGVSRSELQGDGFVGVLFRPAAPGPHPAVALIGGTTGAAAMEPEAALLASRGYVAMVIGYMGLPGLPATLCEIPVEVLAAGIRRLATAPDVDSARLAVLGASVGTEGMLTALAGIPDLPVRAAIAVAPSSVVWQALAEGRPPQKPSWTLAGAPLPYLRMHGERLLPELIKVELLAHLSRHPRPRALHLRASYAAALADEQASERAAIPVERIAAPLLLLGGEDDQMWPSAAMVEAIVRRRQQAGHAEGDRAVTFPEAGHFLGAPIVPTTVTWTESLYGGGTPEGIARAQVEAWQQILSFLAAHLA